MNPPSPQTQTPSGTPPGPRRPLGQILVDGELISAADLDRALQQQKKTGELLGEVLLRLGRLGEPELKAALAIQEDLSSLDRALKLAAGARLRLGELLVESHRITKEDLDRALAEQKRTNEKLGEVLVRLGVLAPAEVEAALAFQSQLEDPVQPSKLRLGEVLVAAGLITPEDLDRALERQKRSEKRLGEILVEAGILEPEKVELGLRLQRRLVAASLAGIMALAGMGFGAAPAEAQSNAQESASMSVSARVVPFTSIEVQEAAGELVITQEDVERGYIEVPGAARVALRSNDPAGYRLRFDIDADFIAAAEVTGLDQPLRLGARGGRIDLPAPETTRQQLDLTFRFELADGARPGHYSWPVRVSGDSRPL